MVFKIIKLKLFLILFSISFTQINIELKDTLNNDVGWIKLFNKNELTISSKNIGNYSLSALKIESIINIPPDIIQDVIMDVDNYEKNLIKSKEVKTKKIEQQKKTIIAYQFIPIHTPFINDRHYLFKMKVNELNLPFPKKIIEWFLIEPYNEYTDSLINAKKKAIYLKYGAGSWILNKTKNEELVLSYRLFLDPGGSLPNFIIDKSNQTSIINIYNDVINESKRRMGL